MGDGEARMDGKRTSRHALFGIFRSRRAQGHRSGEVHGGPHGAHQGHEALPRPHGVQVSVVHCRRSRQGVGKEGVPRAHGQQGRRDAVGLHFEGFPCGRGRPRARMGAAQRRARCTLRLSQPPRARVARIPFLQRHRLQGGAHPRFRLHGRRRRDHGRPLFQPQHPFGGDLHLAQGGGSGGHRLFDQAALLSGRAHRKLLRAL